MPLLAVAICFHITIGLVGIVVARASLRCMAAIVRLHAVGPWPT